MNEDKSGRRSEQKKVKEEKCREGIEKEVEKDRKK